MSFEGTDGMSTADKKAMIAEVWSSDDADFVQHLGMDDVFVKGKAMMVLPGLWTSMDDRLKKAIRARRYAALFGVCPLCRGVGSVVDSGGSEFVHENRCPVSDRPLGRMFARWTRRVGSFAVGERLVEVPQRVTEG